MLTCDDQTVMVRVIQTVIADVPVKVPASLDRKDAGEVAKGKLGKLPAGHMLKVYGQAPQYQFLAPYELQ